MVVCGGRKATQAGLAALALRPAVPSRSCVGSTMGHHHPARFQVQECSRAAIPPEERLLTIHSSPSWRKAHVAPWRLAPGMDTGGGHHVNLNLGFHLLPRRQSDPAHVSACTSAGSALPFLVRLCRGQEVGDLLPQWQQGVFTSAAPQPAPYSREDGRRMAG